MLPSRGQRQFPEAISVLPREAGSRLEEAGKHFQRLDGNFAVQAVAAADDADSEKAGREPFLFSRSDVPAAAR